MRLSQSGIDLIKSFEGLRLTSYLCEANVWTIGYGSTGSDIGPNLTISREEAEDLLRSDLAYFEEEVKNKLRVAVNQNEFDALVSFTFNVGVNAFSRSTLLELLNAGTDRKIVAAEFSRWVKVGNNVSEGLKIRREKEKALFLTKVLHSALSHSIVAQRDTWLKRKPEQASTLAAEEKLFVPKGSAHVWQSIKMVPGEVDYQVQLQAQPDKPWWFYPPHWKIINDPKVVADKPDSSVPRVLNIPYFSQRDNAKDPLRTCFSSSCAMMLKGLKPNSISNDDQYVNTVFSYGDTTSPSAQLMALKHFGVTANFYQNGSWDDIDAQLSQGIAVPIGILHHGSVSSPSGGGHWICVIGKSEDGKSYIVHDPFGDLDLVNGGYVSTNGKSLSYSKKNLGPRWFVEGPNTGWYIKGYK